MEWSWWRRSCGEHGHAPRLVPGPCGCLPEPEFFLRAGGAAAAGAPWRPMCYVWSKGEPRGWFVRLRLPL